MFFKAIVIRLLQILAISIRRPPRYFVNLPIRHVQIMSFLSKKRTLNRQNTSNVHF
ncbi:hypothetical protein FM106_22070 [Brachybacterium faecium]|nr:hypothetical protein FM106_22070 [Brachybacterium faecium]